MYFVRIRAYKVALFMSEMIYWLKKNRFVLHFNFFFSSWNDILYVGPFLNIKI